MKKKLVFLVVVLVFSFVFNFHTIWAGGTQEKKTSSAEATNSEFSWTKYSGSRIRYLTYKIPKQDQIISNIPDFEKLTGIKVEYEQIPYGQFQKKLVVELTSGLGNIDVFPTNVGMNATRFWKAGWYEPLDRFLNDPGLTNPEFDFPDDYPPGAVAISTKAGSLIAIPASNDVNILYYRKDLFEKHGVKVPDTFEEMEDAAKTLTMDTDNDGKIDQFGVVFRGQGAQAVGGGFGAVFHGMGANWFDDNGEPALNTPEAIKAFKYYGRLMRLYAPPGAILFERSDCTTIFSQGKVAMYMDPNGYLKYMEDPEKSLVIGKVGYTIVPKGPAGRQPNLYCWATAISKQSKNQEAAWLFIQYLSSKKSQLDQLLLGDPVARLSAWNDPKFSTDFKHQEWMKASIESMKLGNAEWVPPVTAVAEARDIIGKVIHAAILDKDVEKEAEVAISELKKIIKKTQ